jgi:hypothetical protein
MNHVKKFENIDNYEGTDDEYLSSPEYFIETYINGQFGQLREMLTKFRTNGKFRELLMYIDNSMELDSVINLKNWMLNEMK